MPIDRKLWQEDISKHEVPNWPCPNCGATALALPEGHFLALEDRKSRLRRDDPDAEREATGHFACLLKCGKCEETCAVSGVFDTDELYDKNDFPFFYERGFPKSITPPPRMIHIPEDCPERVRAEVVKAFTLYWSDHASSLNRIRNALELVLSDLGIPNTVVVTKPPRAGAPPPKGKKKRLSLHQRIERLEQKRPKLKDICERMMAVKHLGNAGSHPGVKVQIDDVFDGMDILEGTK
jgi:hypothetical protein